MNFVVGQQSFNFIGMNLVSRMMDFLAATKMGKKGFEILKELNLCIHTTDLIHTPGNIVEGNFSFRQ